MITAQLASLPEREETLKLTVESLLPQVDSIFVALNGYNGIPAFLSKSRKIKTVLTDNSLGDATKFYDIEYRKGYVLTCDDDLIYPPGYSSYMINKIHQLNGIVSLLGKAYSTRPVKSFRNGYTELYRCLGHVPEDKRVDVCGTGAMAFDTEMVKVSLSDFPVANMADMWMAKIAHEQNIPIFVVKHRIGYVRHKLYENRIWVDNDDDKYQTEVVNSFLK